MNYGCIFCRTGREESFAKLITENFPYMDPLVVKKIRIIRKGRESFEQMVVLFPGYVFFRMENVEQMMESKILFPREFQQINRWSDSYKLLKDVDGDWRLSGRDLDMVKTFYDFDGVIGLSKAYFDKGERIRILDGFMKDYEGNITRVDRRHRTAEVTIDFQGKIIRMWLGYEMMEAPVNTDNG